MKNFYYKLGHKKFLMIAAVLLLCGDFFYSWRTLRGFSDYGAFEAQIEQLVEQARQQGNSEIVKPLEEMPEGYLKEIFLMTKNFTYMVSAIFIILHSAIYIFLVLGKQFSHYYAILLSLMAGLTSLMSIFFGSAIYVLPTLTYSFVFMGLLTLGRSPESLAQENS